MKILLALLLIAAPVGATEERELRCDEETCTVRTGRSVPRIQRPLIREPSHVILSPLRGPQSTMPPVTTRTRRVRVSPNGRVTVGY